MLTEHFSGDPEDMAALYRGEHDFVACERNPLPRSEEWLREQAEDMARETTAPAEHHLENLRIIDKMLVKAMRRPANDNRGRVR